MAEMDRKTRGSDDRGDAPARRSASEPGSMLGDLAARIGPAVLQRKLVQRKARGTEGGAQASPGPAGPDAGSALVVASAQTTESAHDNTFTPQLQKMLEENPRRSLDEALQAMASSGKPIHGKGEDANQYATSAQIGDRDARGGAGGGKHATLVANFDYLSPSLPDLRTPLGEANRLAGALGGRGYTTDLRKNLTANEMRTAFATAALGSKAQPGDHVVLHYGGHGVEKGLCGVKLDGLNQLLGDARENARLAPREPGASEGQPERHDIKPIPGGLDAKDPGVEGLDPNDLLPHAALQSIAQGAVGRGVHLTVILDACHSGAATDLIHDERHYPAAGATANSPAPAPAEGAPAASPVPDAVELIRSAKLGLTKMLASWSADRLGAKRGDSWDEKQLDDMLFDLDLRYASTISHLWKEFLVPRVLGALQSVQSLAPRPFTMPPAFDGNLTRGLLCDEKSQPLLEWLDQTREAIRALESAKPPTKPGA